MENIDNIRTLADAAYESKSFEQAYQYYTRLLEADPGDARAWLGKGLSAGWSSVPENAKFDELIVSVKQAFKNGLGDDEKARVADEALEAADSYTKKALRAYVDGVSEFDKVPMKEGVAYAIHNMGRLSYNLKNGAKQGPGWLKAIDTMEFAADLAPSTARYSKAIAAADFLRNHSRQNTNYLGDDKHPSCDYAVLGEQRNRLFQKAQSLDPNFAAQQVANSGGGCFVATATLGDFDHPFVVELRHYRDSVLTTSTPGRLFVKAYYKFGPYPAALITRHPRLRGLSLELLIRPAVAFARMRNKGARPSP